MRRHLGTVSIIERAYGHLVAGNGETDSASVRFTPLLNQFEQRLLHFLQFRNFVVIEAGPVLAFLQAADEPVDVSKTSFNLLTDIDLNLALCLLQFTSSS
jgi:hypothetical protein